MPPDVKGHQERIWRKFGDGCGDSLVHYGRSIQVNAGMSRFWTLLSSDYAAQPGSCHGRVRRLFGRGLWVLDGRDVGFGGNPGCGGEWSRVHSRPEPTLYDAAIAGEASESATSCPMVLLRRPQLRHPDLCRADPGPDQTLWPPNNVASGMLEAIGVAWRCRSTAGDEAGTTDQPQHDPALGADAARSARRARGGSGVDDFALWRAVSTAPC